MRAHLLYSKFEASLGSEILSQKKMKILFIIASKVMEILVIFDKLSEYMCVSMYIYSMQTILAVTNIAQRNQYKEN